MGYVYALCNNGTKTRREMRHQVNSKSTKSIVAATLAILTFAAAQPSLANEPNSGPFFGNNAPGKWIIGGKIANVDPNTPGVSVSDADAAGIVLGYEFATPIGNGGGSSTVEFEYFTGDSSGSALDLDYDVDIANIFFTYRSPGKLYYKLKGGLTYTNFDINVLDVESDFEDVSFGWGAGLGYRVGDLGVLELEYSADTGDSDIDVIAVNALLEF